jgi:hypothetical protein
MKNLSIESTVHKEGRMPPSLFDDSPRPVICAGPTNATTKQLTSGTQQYGTGARSNKSGNRFQRTSAETFTTQSLDYNRMQTHEIGNEDPGSLFGFGNQSNAGIQSQIRGMVSQQVGAHDRGSYPAGSNIQYQGTTRSKLGGTLEGYPGNTASVSMQQQAPGRPIDSYPSSTLVQTQFHSQSRAGGVGGNDPSSLQPQMTVTGGNIQRRTNETMQPPVQRVYDSQLSQKAGAPLAVVDNKIKFTIKGSTTTQQSHVHNEMSPQIGSHASAGGIRETSQSLQVNTAVYGSVPGRQSPRSGTGRVLPNIPGTGSPHPARAACTSDNRRQVNTIYGQETQNIGITAMGNRTNIDTMQSGALGSQSHQTGQDFVGTTSINSRQSQQYGGHMGSHTTTRTGYSRPTSSHQHCEGPVGYQSPAAITSLTTCMENAIYRTGIGGTSSQRQSGGQSDFQCDTPGTMLNSSNSILNNISGCKMQNVPSMQNCEVSMSSQPTTPMPSSSSRTLVCHRTPTLTASQVDTATNRMMANTEVSTPPQQTGVRYSSIPATPKVSSSSQVRTEICGGTKTEQEIITLDSWARTTKCKMRGSTLSKTLTPGPAYSGCKVIVSSDQIKETFSEGAYASKGTIKLNQRIETMSGSVPLKEKKNADMYTDDMEFSNTTQTESTSSLYKSLGNYAESIANSINYLIETNDTTFEKSRQGTAMSYTTATSSNITATSSTITCVSTSVSTDDNLSYRHSSYVTSSSSHTNNYSSYTTNANYTIKAGDVSTNLSYTTTDYNVDKTYNSFGDSNIRVGMHPTSATSVNTFTVTKAIPVRVPPLSSAKAMSLDRGVVSEHMVSSTSRMPGKSMSVDASPVSKTETRPTKSAYSPVKIYHMNTYDIDSKQKDSFQRNDGFVQTGTAISVTPNTIRQTVSTPAKMHQSDQIYGLACNNICTSPMAVGAYSSEPTYGQFTSTDCTAAQITSAAGSYQSNLSQGQYGANTTTSTQRNSSYYSETAVCSSNQIYRQSNIGSKTSSQTSSGVYQSNPAAARTSGSGAGVYPMNPVFGQTTNANTSVPQTRTSSMPRTEYRLIQGKTPVTTSQGSTWKPFDVTSFSYPEPDKGWKIGLCDQM